MGNSIESLAFILVAGGAVWFVYGPWQTYCEDSARQDLFDARNAIFDLAAGGKLSFESPEYREIRNALNCFIRYAHQLTLSRLIAYVLFMPQPERTLDLSELMSRIQDGETRVNVEHQMGKASTALLLLLVYRSPLLWPLLGFRIVVRNIVFVNSVRVRVIDRVRENAIAYCGA